MILGQWGTLNQWGNAAPAGDGLTLSIANQKWVSLLSYTFPTNTFFVEVDFTTPVFTSETQQILKLRQDPIGINFLFNASGEGFVYVSTNTEAVELSVGNLADNTQYVLNIALNISSGAITVLLDTASVATYTIESPSDFSGAVTTEGIDTSLGNSDNIFFTDSVIHELNINNQRTYTGTPTTFNDSTSGSNGTVVTNSSNTAPTVTVTANKATYAAGETITFTADANDINGDTLTYAWSSGETTSSITVVAPTGGSNSTVTRSCIVNDGDVNSASSSETVNVNAQENRAPTLVVTANKATYEAGETITFTATGSDLDGDALTYLWSSGETTQIIAVTAPTSATASTVTRSCVANDGQLDSDIEFKTVNVNAEADTTAPVITVSGPESQTIAYNGAVPTFTSSTDDGSSITIGGDTVDNQTAGTYIKTFNSSDSSGNAATEVTRTVIVEEEVIADTTAPIITVSGGSTTTIAFNGVVPTFNSSTDDGSAVVSGGTVNNAVAGTYTLTFNSTDAAGNVATQVTRVVIVQEEVIADTTAPVITVSGLASTTIDFGGAIPTFTSVTDDGSTVIVGGQAVNNNLAGTYVITFNSTDAAGNAATQVNRVVIVEEEVTSTPGQTQLAISRATFILDGDGRYERFAGRSNETTFNFMLEVASDDISVTADGYFDFSNNYIDKVELIVGGSIISTVTDAVVFNGKNLFAELGGLEGLGQPPLVIVVYVTGDAKGVVIAGPNLRSSPIISMQ